jgi:penicillin-insensitive murein DD-endopeptidase
MAKIESLLPVSGVGFRTNNRTNNSHFATQVTHDLLIKIAGLWHDLHPNNPISIGQISHKGGGEFPPHHQHRLGIEADMRLLSKNGQDLILNFESPQYSRDLTREFVKLLRANARMHRVFFNDPKLMAEGLTSHAAGHNDHLHLWFEEEQESTPRVLRNFTKGDDVKRLQEKLIAAGFPIEGGADGKFGDHTEDAVRAFQAAHPPLTANGIADEATQSALGL